MTREIVETTGGLALVAHAAIGAKILKIKWVIMAIAAVSISGCSLVPPSVTRSRTDKAELVVGPPVEDVVTAFDDALTCVRGKVQPGITFAVGQIVDATGKESYAEGATGKFVTQGAGEMVQSSLFRAGVSVVNRRDPNILIVETQWGIRDLTQQIPVNFYISGSINSLDFIPGGGFSVQLAGAGPRYRQNRILIGLDLTMTDAFTGRIVANVPLQKQIFSREVGASMGRFFGETLVSLEMGGQEREAVHFALRQMLSFATFELLGQLMNADTFAPCKEKVSPFYGAVSNTGTSDPDALRNAVTNSASAREAQQATRVASAQPQQRQQAALSIDEQVKELANNVMVFGARAVAAAEESLAADNTTDAAKKSAEATELLRGAVQLLQRAAELGLEGPAGDAAALVVERALTLVSQAQEDLASRTSQSPSAPLSDTTEPGIPAEGAVTSAPSPPRPSAAPIPGTAAEQRMGVNE